jgi:putative N6-adenine-specific DNA methylase
MAHYLYQENRRYFAQIADGLEEQGIQELYDLGATNATPAYRGLYFEADPASLYRVNYCSRLITRVLAPLTSFTCRDTDELYLKAKMIPWGDFLNLNRTFAIFSTGSNSNITHSQYAGLRLKDAIADYFMEKYSKRPDVERIDPDVWLSLHIEKKRAVISLDTSGGSLHRRGYRTENVPASMQETVAAAIIRLSGWDGTRPLHDPFCGSGTLLCEALMYYCRMPSAMLRKKFGFEFLPDFDPAAWDTVKKQEDGRIRKLPKHLISGSDISKNVLSAALTNIRHLPHGQNIHLKPSDFQNIPDLKDRIIITNPPYGIRLEKENITQLYKELGDFLKQRCQGTAAYIYFGNREWIKHVGLKPTWKKPLKNGGLDGRLVKYELY